MQYEALNNVLSIYDAKNEKLNAVEAWKLVEFIEKNIEKPLLRIQKGTEFKIEPQAGGLCFTANALGSWEVCNSDMMEIINVAIQLKDAYIKEGEAHD